MPTKNKNSEPSYYAIIPADVRYADIPPNAKLLYGEITALCNKEGFCWSSNSYFAKLYKKNVTTISEWVSILQKEGFVSVETDGKNRKIYLMLREKPFEASGKGEGYASGKAEHNNTRGNSTENNTRDASVAPSKPLFTSIGADVLKAFEGINPATKKMYNNPPQRQACEDLIAEYGFEQVIKVVGFVEKYGSRPYFPTITTPMQLFQKWSALQQAVMRNQSKTDEIKSRITPDI